MSRLTTHVLDTANGKPGSGISVKLFSMENGRHLVATAVTNVGRQNGCPVARRRDVPSRRVRARVFGRRLLQGRGRDVANPPFLDDVVIRVNALRRRCTITCPARLAVELLDVSRQLTWAAHGRSRLTEQREVRAGRRNVEVTGCADPNRTLLQFLREDRRSGPGPRKVVPKAIAAPARLSSSLRSSASDWSRAPSTACIRFLPNASTALESVTVEGSEPGRTDIPVQQAHRGLQHASQCGFCTPGFVMSLFALYKDERIADSTRD